MVRQDHLESLADPTLSESEMFEARGVVNFIKEFLDVIRPNLIHRAESEKRKAAGMPPPGHVEGNPYVELSGTHEDLPEGLTSTN